MVSVLLGFPFPSPLTRETRLFLKIFLSVLVRVMINRSKMESFHSTFSGIRSLICTFVVFLRQVFLERLNDLPNVTKLASDKTETRISSLALLFFFLSHCHCLFLFYIGLHFYISGCKTIGVKLCNLVIIKFTFLQLENIKY